MEPGTRCRYYRQRLLHVLVLGQRRHLDRGPGPGLWVGLSVRTGYDYLEGLHPNRQRRWQHQQQQQHLSRQPGQHDRSRGRRDILYCQHHTAAAVAEPSAADGDTVVPWPCRRRALHPSTRRTALPRHACRGSRGSPACSRPAQGGTGFAVRRAVAARVRHQHVDQAHVR